MSVVYGEVGDRVVLLRCDDKFTQLQPGEKGVIDHVDSTGTRFVKWDNGSSLGLVQGVDEYRVIELAADARYRIVRVYADDRPKEEINSGLTLEEAQAHCQDKTTAGDGWMDVYYRELS